MNKKLVLAVALVFGAAGLILAQGIVKAQDDTDNSAMNSDNSAMNSDDDATANADNSAVNADSNSTVNADNPATSNTQYKIFFPSSISGSGK